MPIPTANEIRNYLRGYCVDMEDTFSVTGTTVAGQASITGIDTTKIEPQMRISGTAFAAPVTVLSVDTAGTDGIITVSAGATTTDAGITFTVTFFSETTNEWITQRRDRTVIPWIERVTGQTITQTTEVEEYYSGNGSSILILNRRPVREITNITYTNIPAETQTGNLLESIELIQEEGILKSRVNFNEGSFDPVFANGKDNIKVRYIYGYSDTPDDLCEAVLLMTSTRVLNHIGSRTGGGRISQNSYSRDFGPRGKYTDVMNQMDADAFSIIRKYTSAVVGA